MGPQICLIFLYQTYVLSYSYINSPDEGRNVKKFFWPFLGSYYTTFDAKLFLAKYNECHNATESADFVTDWPTQRICNSMET